MNAPSSGTRLFSPLVVLLLSAGMLRCQTPGASTLPVTAPTQGGMTAPLAANATAADHAGTAAHPAQVSCPGGQLQVHAVNSSLNGILRAISRCTGMRIEGGVAEQRVFGDYGPAAPATVLATLLDGTGINMLLKETAADQPAQLILTPRTGGVTPPPPSSYADAENGNVGNQPPQGPPQFQGGPQNPYMQRGRPMQRTGMPVGMPMGEDGTQGNNQQGGNQTPVPNPNYGSPVTSPPSVPTGINNVNGSPNNTSPTASTYPTTNSVPLDSVATPSTTPPANGIVDAPNPPPAGSDTAAALNGAPNGRPGTTNIDPNATSQTSTPGASNSTVQAPADLTPEQIFQQLQQRQQQQQQQQQQDSNPQ